MLYEPSSQISPEQSEGMLLGGMDTKTPDGYRRVSLTELRALYGTYMNQDNLHMPMAQYLAMQLDIVRSLTSYKGVHVCKNPMDSWVFQEIIYERKPNVIIEIGNQGGGSTMMLSDHLFDSEIDDAKYVIGIDISRERLHPKAKGWHGIKWIDGDACDPAIFEQVVALIEPTDRVMIIDDSSHEYESTLNILRTFGPLVKQGQYFIVEDTMIGAFIPFGEERIRANEAVDTFMEETDDFVVDRKPEKWFITLNPGGYLEKVR